MAILWPTTQPEQARPGEALRRALGHAVALVEGGAGVLALRSDGEEGEDERAPGAAGGERGEPTLWTVGISREAGRRLVAVLAQNPTPEPLDGRPRTYV